MCYLALLCILQYSPQVWLRRCGGEILVRVELVGKGEVVGEHEGITGDRFEARAGSPCPCRRRQLPWLSWAVRKSLPSRWLEFDHSKKEIPNIVQSSWSSIEPGTIISPFSPSRPDRASLQGWKHGLQSRREERSGRRSPCLMVRRANGELAMRVGDIIILLY